VIVYLIQFVTNGLLFRLNVLVLMYVRCKYFLNNTLLITVNYVELLFTETQKSVSISFSYTLKMSFTIIAIIMS